MATVYPRGWPVIIEGLDDDATHLQQLARTLDLLPVAHVAKLPTITVGNRPDRGGGGSASRTMPGGPYIRLNVTCFSSSWNRGFYNYTLLHEVGHIIDWEYGCMANMRRTDHAGYQALLRHPHSGATQGDGEHYGDAYADFFCYGPSRLSQERLDALVGSTAFQAPTQYVC